MDKTMSLEGGVDQYGIMPGGSERYLDRKSPEGRKVVYTNKNGYDAERRFANTLFEEGQILTVREIYVGRSDSTVEFIEYPGNRFNTVMFADVE